MTAGRPCPARSILARAPAPPARGASASARRPREVRGGVEGGAALVELARLAVGLAEAEQQLAAGRGGRRLGQIQSSERAVEVTRGLLVCERRQRAPGRAGRVLDRLGRRARLGGRDEVIRELAERRLGIAGLPLLEDRADPAVQGRPAGRAERRVQASREAARGRTRSVLERRAPPRGSVARSPPRAHRARLAVQAGDGLDHLGRARPADGCGRQHHAARASTASRAAARSPPAHRRGCRAP